MTHILAQLQNDWDAEYEASTVLPGTGLTIVETRAARIAQSEAYQTWWAGFGDEPRNPETLPRNGVLLARWQAAWGQSAAYLRRNGFLDMWFLFFTGYVLTLGTAAAFISLNPEVLM